MLHSYFSPLNWCVLTPKQRWSLQKTGCLDRYVRFDYGIRFGCFDFLKHFLTRCNGHLQFLCPFAHWCDFLCLCGFHETMKQLVVWMDKNHVLVGILIQSITINLKLVHVQRGPKNRTNCTGLCHVGFQGSFNVIYNKSLSNENDFLGVYSSVK